MFNCSRCQAQVQFEDAKFAGDECLCPSCASSNDVSIGGLPVSMFGLLMSVIAENPESNHSELLVKFMSSEGASPSFAGQVQQLIVLLKNNDFASVSFDDLQSAIQVLMFFSNFTQYEAEQNLRNGRTQYSEATVELAVELVFNY